MPQFTRREFLASSSFLLLPPALRVQTPRQRHWFGTSWPAAKLGRVLLPRERWKPYPAAAERAAWEGLPKDARESCIQLGDRHLGEAWPLLPATLFLEFVRTGNRSNFERVFYTRRDILRELVLGECAEGKGRFLDQIVNGIWIICEETFWGLPAHLNLQKAGPGLPDVAEPTVDLFAAETADLLAWVEYLLGPQLDSLSPLIRPRIQLEISRRILRPNLERTDFWWMGLDPNLRQPVNNWNPWINSNWLTCALLVEPNEERRLATVHKILRSLDRFLESYHDDGGCDEGPGYWSYAGGALFDCLELLSSASDGAINFYEMPLVQEIGRYIVRAHIHDDYFINFADASARMKIPGDLVFRYGLRIRDEKMQGLGAFAATGPWDPTESIGRCLPALFNLGALRSAPRRQPLLRDVWLPGIQVMAARRQAGSADGLYLAAQGGHNAESHNHNDVGNFIVYADGQPIIIDVGVETYSAKTFSPKRYEIWTMQSAYHNLPTVDDVMQGAGREFAAREVSYEADDSAAEFSLDIAAAYPPETRLESWRRILRFQRVTNRIEVSDSYSLKKPVRRITLTLMTSCKVTRSAQSELTFSGPFFRSGAVKVLYDAQALTAAFEEIPIHDAQLKAVWGDHLYRVLLIAEKPSLKASWTLSIVQQTA